MNNANINTNKMMAWHHLRGKVLTKKPLTDREYKMVGKLMAACEGTIFPTVRQISNYKMLFQQMITTDANQDKDSFQVYVDSVAELEERFVRPYDNIFRRV